MHQNQMNQDWPAEWPPPELSEAVFVAPNATVLGDVRAGLGSSIWYGAILRGDVERIEIGAYSNIQDGAVLHGDPGYPTILEDHVTVGHRAVIHSAYIERGCLIGIGAIVLNGVRIGAGSIVGAGAVVSKNIPPQTLWVGVPAKQLRVLEHHEVEDLLNHAQNYMKLGQAHHHSIKG
jgi:carbonic anhydrase/acetyltransferase-like protein (isoleucine patch superfamily)